MAADVYTLEVTDHPDRPWVVMHGDFDDPVFTFTLNDEIFARQTLLNLNGSNEDALPAFGDEASLSLEDRDALAESV